MKNDKKMKNTKKNIQENNEKACTIIEQKKYFEEKTMTINVLSNNEICLIDTGNSKNFVIEEFLKKLDKTKLSFKTNNNQNNIRIL